MKECGHCGCNDIEPAGVAHWLGGRRYQRWRCNFCGATSSEPLAPPRRLDDPDRPVAFSTNKPACPICGGPTIVYRTVRSRRVRYLRCKRHPDDRRHRTKQAAS